MRFDLLGDVARSSGGKSLCASLALTATLILATTERVRCQQPAGTYLDQQGGETAESLVARALASNGDLIAARRNVERARSRLLQAGLRPNPIISFEQATGRLTGSAGDRTTQVEFAYPFELGGKRARRIQLAEADSAAAEADIANRERLLAGDVMNAYADALAALRELEIMENTAAIDATTTRLTAARVAEGDAAPLEVRLLGVEVQRQQARRTLAEGRLQSALVRLKSLVGSQLDAALRFRNKLGGTDKSLGSAPMSLMMRGTPLPASLEQAISIALETRPDLQLARDLRRDGHQTGNRVGLAATANQTESGSDCALRLERRRCQHAG